MAEKRFYLLNYNNYPIYDSLNDKEYNAQFKAQREKLCLLLNELNEENYILKKRNKYFEEYNNKLLRKPLLTDILPNAMEIISINNELEEENEYLKRENEELKQFKQQVINLIDEKIIFVDACTQNYKLSYDYYHGALDILELLKKECFE